MFLIWRISDR